LQAEGNGGRRGGILFGARESVAAGGRTVMVGRASWKGFLKIGELTCPVGLYAAASTSDRIAFHTLNRKTGNRVHRAFVDAVTGEEVDRDHQVKGYETAKDEHIVLTPEEVAAAVPDADKTLSVTAFLSCDDVDTLYLDRPYFLAPDGAIAAEPYALIRDGLRAKSAAALASTVLFRRARTLLVRPFEDGLIATTLKFDYEVRSAAEAFEEVPEIKIEGEMLELAEHIIKSKRGTFRPEAFEDRYEAALEELVKAKLEGRKIRAPKPPPKGKVVDLLDALRRSAGVGAADDDGSATGRTAAAKATRTSAAAKATGGAGKAASSKSAATKSSSVKPSASKASAGTGAADKTGSGKAKAASKAGAATKRRAAPQRKAG
jgi:DNA end-binding protein Ku